MVTRILEFILEAISIFIFVMTPFVLVWGWIRWARGEKQSTTLPVFSFIGFALATLSALLAVASVLYSNAIGGFPYYDRRLMRIYACGTLLSATALVLSLTGLWRHSSLRWHALFCSCGTLIYWFAMGETE